MDTSRKYLVMFNRREFHLTESKEIPCQPVMGDNIGYSDSKQSLIHQNFIPCRFCLSDITVQEINSIASMEFVHSVYEAG